MAKKQPEPPKKGGKPAPKSAPAAKREAKKPAPKKEPAAGPKLLRTEIPLDRVDRTYADLVRAAVSEDHVRRIADAYEDPEQAPQVAPVEAFTWEGADTWLLAEGGHRCRAKELLGKKKVDAEVWVCADEPDARRRALLRAAAANEHPGLTRSPADKRAAVRAVVLAPEHASTKDRAVADACKVHHVLVRQVREQLSAAGEISEDSPAHAKTRGYKADAKLRGGLPSDGKGNIVKPTPPPSPPAPVPPAAPEPEPDADRPDPHAPDTGEPVASAAPPPVVARPPTPAADAAARAVPVGTYDLPPELFPKLAAAGVTTAGDLADMFAAGFAAGERWGLDDDALDGLAQMLQDVPTDDAPYCLCPLIDPATGYHRQPGSCRVCSGRTTITRGKYLTLSADLKTHCRPGVVDLPEPPTRPDPAPKVLLPKTEHHPELGAAIGCAAGIVRDLRAAQAGFDLLLSGRGGAYLRGVTLGGKPLAGRRPVRGRSGSTREEWVVPLIAALVSAVRRARPARLCAGCRGAGCVACRPDSGFLPDDESILSPKDGGSALDFGDPWDVKE